jgi:uncharacterized damage-inducible protein DinB
MTQDPAPTPEIDVLYRYLCRTVDKLLAALDGLNAEQLAWQPPAREANSLSVIVTHVLGNVEENILEILCGQPVHRQRDAEFAAGVSSAEALRGRWQAIQGRMQAAIAGLPADELDRFRTHERRGTITGREVFLVAMRHAAEHSGQAELTRDLLQAAPPAA